MTPTPPFISATTTRLDDERGQTMTEYAILASVIVIALALVLPLVASPIDSILRAAAAAFTG